MNNQQKIVFLSRSIYPAYKGGSSFVIESLSKNFKKDEFVVIGGKTFFGTKLKRSANATKFYYLNSEININGRGHRYFQLFRWMLLPFSLISVLNIFRKEKPSKVISVFPDNYYCLLGVIASRMSGLPYFSYFHNSYLENRKGIDKVIAKLLQPLIFNNSKLIFVISKGMKSYYVKAYPKISHKFKVLVHTFYDYPEIDNHLQINPKNNTFNLVAVGNINGSNIDATKSFIEAIKNDKRFNFNVYTTVPKQLLYNRGVDPKNFNYKGYISDENFYLEISKNDMCILLHGFEGGYSEIEYKTIFPTRTIPLLLSKKPLLVLCPTDSYLSHFIAEHDCGELINKKDPKSIIEGLERVLLDSERYQQLVNNSEKAVQIFYGANVVNKLKTDLINSDNYF